MNMKETPTNPGTHRTAGIPLAGALDFSARLVAILAAVTAFIFARNHILAALSLPLHNRIAGASRRIAALLARLAEGTFRARPHTPRPGAKGGPPPIQLPGRRAWLVIKFGHHAAAYASHLEHLLRDPATLATIAAAPPEALKSLGRTLRPIAHLLGVTLPKELLLSPRPPPTAVTQVRNDLLESESTGLGRHESRTGNNRNIRFQGKKWN